MKKYLKILPLIFYPYAYLIVLFFFPSIGKLMKEGTNGGEIFSKLELIAIVLYNLWVLFLSLWSAIGGLKRYTPAEAAKMNLAIKGLQIPAYLFHFSIGVFGALANVFGIGFVAFAILIDLVTVFLSGLFAVGSVRRLKKEGVLSSGKAFWAGFGSFLYCVDVIVAIVLVQQCRKKFPQEEAALHGTRQKLRALAGTERGVRIRKRLTYLSALLMALYPYMLYASLSSFISFSIAIAVITCALLIIVIRSAYDAFSLHSPLAAAGLNLAVKGFQAPAYIINFFSGVFMGISVSLGMVGVNDLMYFIFLVVFSTIMIALSGVYAIGCVRKLEKEGVLSSGAAVLALIGSFLFVVDVIVAIVLVVMCKSKKSGTAAEKAAPPPLPPAAPTPAPAPNEAEQKE